MNNLYNNKLINMYTKYYITIYIHTHIHIYIYNAYEYNYYEI